MLKYELITLLMGGCLLFEKRHSNFFLAFQWNSIETWYIPWVLFIISFNVLFFVIFKISWGSKLKAIF